MRTGTQFFSFISLDCRCVLEWPCNADLPVVLGSFDGCAILVVSNLVIEES